MSVKIRYVGLFSSKVGKTTEELKISDKQTIMEIINKIVEAHPQVRREIFEATGTMKNYVNILVNQKSIRYLEELDTIVKPGDAVTLLTAVGGG